MTDIHQAGYTPCLIYSSLPYSLYFFIMNRQFFAFLFLSFLLLSCKNEPESRTVGSIESFQPELEEVLGPNPVLEIIAKGFEWSEGPLWVEEQQMLLFSDVPENKIYKWTEASGTETYLDPSGYTGTENREGSNGLLLDRRGRLILCQHGDRRLARMDAPLEAPLSKFITLADQYSGKRLNSPNDATFNKEGDLFFTDPPYGLPKGEEDPEKEIPFQGVYRLSPNGQILLLLGTLSRPNGIALSPDEQTLYVANSDPEKAIWMAYDFSDSGLLTNSRLLFDATEQTATEKGLPDGLKVNKQGYLFATGPGGLWILNPEGTPLGLVRTGEATSNCAFNADESVLYITADSYIMRLTLDKQ
jgi:gluconolactonase